MTRIYDILIDNTKIGTTDLEKADAPMGVVFGKIYFINIASGYDFFKTYCKTNNIKIMTDYPKDRLITTTDIPNLKVINANGIEIKGRGTNLVLATTFNVSFLEYSCVCPAMLNELRSTNIISKILGVISRA